MVEWRMDIKSATIIETATQIVKKVSNWRSSGITFVENDKDNEKCLERVVLEARKAEIIG